MFVLRLSIVMALALLAAAPAQARKMIVVDYGAGLIYPLQDGDLVRSPIITNPGRVLRQKYLGTFRITEKIVDKRSNMYNTHGNPISPGETGASMRYWMRVGHTAQGFHHSTAFSPTGPRHRSRGCYRLSKSSAVWLFNWAPVGTQVVVVNSVCTPRFAYLAKGRCGVKSASRGASGGAASARKPAAAAPPKRARVVPATRKR